MSQYHWLNVLYFILLHGVSFFVIRHNQKKITTNASTLCFVLVKAGEPFQKSDYLPDSNLKALSLRDLFFCPDRNLNIDARENTTTSEFAVMTGMDRIAMP